MGAINGTQFIERINRLNANIWLNGRKLAGRISEHPAFKGILQSKAELYDLQHDPTLKNKLTYTDLDTGEVMGLSFLQPKTYEDLVKRRTMMELWARHTHGMMGRSPDYMNSVLMAFASSAAILVGRKGCFPEHIQALYKRAKENDLSFTHTFITPQTNRGQLAIPFSEKKPISARVIERTEKGLIITGARLLATQGGLTDEVLVYTGGGIFHESEAYAFSIPTNTRGLKFICRESFISSDSAFNSPLGSRYEEMDTILVFEEVLVPWECVFFYDNLEAANDFMVQGCFHHFATHQAVTRQIIKTEFVLGLAGLLVETINVGGYQHIQEKLAEIIVGLETMKSLILKAEIEAETDDYGILRPNLRSLQAATIIFPRIYPRFSEIIQLIGASGMVTLPTEEDFQSGIREDLDQYLQASCRTAEERVKIFRLAWDLTMSSFGTRQTQYERYFFGDPVRLSSLLYKSYPVSDNMKQVTNFLDIDCLPE
ncbi:4-hydroxyphenylacetate 3-monooxygenase, oxygenase component [Bacillus rubiinfantis]|uniref:4-hydroxyphenylacetate 3-monooxygenase, oxygenase component n=1 Tax=Bacillus rubiinfantis TaxID=1499680 RepID=UPI0005AA0364|nr:4-hydroxyphenylacetate 3-monooxygenase, oxygenase component [Bacillus rubiinfantis]